MSILLRDGLLVTQDDSRTVLRGNLYAEDDRIAQVGGPERSADVEIDASGCVVIPGLINGYVRLLDVLLPPSCDLSEEEFARLFRDLHDRITRRDLQLVAALAAAEAVLSGTTCLMDLYRWEDEVARALTQVRVRGCLAWQVSEPGRDLRSFEQFVRKVQGWDGVVPMIGAGDLEVAPAVAQAAGKHRLRWCLPLAGTRSEVYRFQRSHGVRPVEWLEAQGLLSSRLVALHCVWLTLGEVRALGRKEVKAIHTPTLDQMSGSGGYMPVLEMLREGVTVGLGTGSPARCGALDLFQHMRVCAMLHRGHRWDATVLPAQEVLDMGTRGAAECLGVEAGILRAGALADFVVLDPGRRANLRWGPEEVISYLAHRADGSHVRDVVVGGEVVVEDGGLLTVDLEGLREDVEALRAELAHEDPGYR